MPANFSFILSSGGVIEGTEMGKLRVASNVIDTVMSVQSLHANGDSAIEFCDNLNMPRLYVGHGNPNSVLGMANTSFAATRHQGGVPDDLLLCVFADDGRKDGVRVTKDGDVVLGSPTPLATNATVGFVQLPTCPGDPTGVAPVGSAVVNSVDKKLCISNGDGTWTKQ